MPRRPLLALSLSAWAALVLACGGAPRPTTLIPGAHPEDAAPAPPSPPAGVAPAPAEPEPPPEKPDLPIAHVGRWKLVDARGRITTWYDLRGDGDARASHDPDVAGIWRMHGDDIRLTWSDGRRDLFRPAGEVWEVSSYAPGADWDALPATPTLRQRAGRDGQTIPPLPRPPVVAAPPRPRPKRPPFVGPPRPIPIPVVTAAEARRRAEELDHCFVRLKGFATVRRSRKGCWAEFEERGVRLATVVIANGDDPSLRDLREGASESREVVLEAVLRGVQAGQLDLSEAQLLPPDAGPGYWLPGRAP